MAIEPRVLLFDEPLSNLDAKLRVALRTEIRRIQQQLGITSIYVTHDQSEAMALSDLVVVMNAGRVEQAGTPDEVYRRPSSRFVADFIGRANFVEGPVERADGSGAVEVSLFGQLMRVPAADGQQPGSRAVVVVRPESIRVGAGDLRGRVRRATFLGPMAEYELEVGDEVLVAVDPDWMGHGLHELGEEVALSLRPERAYALPPGGAEEAPAPIDPEAAEPEE
jgi:iron(III) transport system ATP-binding protein